jgi:O-antigen ligase
MSTLLTPFQRSHFLGPCLGLALMLSSLNSKLMGLAWLMLVLAGLWGAFQKRRLPTPLVDHPWIASWLWIATAALLIKTVPMLYWSDPWEERHGELRLLLGAWALYGLVGWQSLTRNTLVILAHALSLSSALGLFWVLAYGRTELATHHIPWAGAMAMVSALLLALSLKSDFAPALRRIWWVGGLLAVMAVLSSQSRGAYGIVLWWLMVGLHHLWSRRRCSKPVALASPVSAWRKWTWLIGVCVGVGLLSQTPVLERPNQSIQDAVKELQMSHQSATEAANTSVGARLYMWQQSLEAIEASPFWGHGRVARKNLLMEWAQSADSHEVKRLGHVHNEYLNQLVDHGVWGLASQWVYLLGLWWISWRLLRRTHVTAALAVAGMTFVHMSTSITNVNFAHNYYTAALSLFVGLSLWLSTLRKASNATKSP